MTYSTKPTEIDELAWTKTFKPIINPVRLVDADEDGYIGPFDFIVREFETYGPELQVVESLVDLNRVWTQIQVDDCEYVVSGYHRVNRLYHFITEVPYNSAENTAVHWCTTCPIDEAEHSLQTEQEV
jgi:hypothetical protein